MQPKFDVGGDNVNQYITLRGPLWIDSKSLRDGSGANANALYAYCVAQPQPVDHPVCSEYKDMVLTDLTMGRTSGWSVGVHLWLEYVKCSDGLNVQHIHNGKELRLGRHGMRVDGYCAST